MKKHLLIAGLLCAAIIPPAFAVTKCVKLSSSTTCSFVEPGYNVVDWTSNCTTSGTSIAIRGISQCSSTSGSSIGQTATALEISGGTDDKYCWCKMVSPAVSSWVYNNVLGTSYCGYRCAYSCAYRAADNASFRSALFDNLSD